MEIKRKAMRRPRLSYQMGIDGDIVEFPKKDRQNWSWTDSQRLRANHIRQITEDLKKYWPLTVRQVYYRSLGVVPGSNIKSWYDTLSKLITQMRIDGQLDWDAIEDRTRQLYERQVWENRYEYLQWKVKDFFGDYDRCYVQNQENYVEIWVEKDALAHILQRAAGPFCVKVLTGRGYQSITVQQKYVEERAKKAIALGQKPYILYFGDFDPRGINILESAIQNIHDKLDMPDVTFIRVGLTLDQIRQYDLPLVPVKVSDTLANEHLRKYGDVAAELDALHPEVLEDLVVNSLEKVLDFKDMMQQYNEEKVEKKEFAERESFITDIILDSFKP